MCLPLRTTMAPDGPPSLLLSRPGPLAPPPLYRPARPMHGAGGRGRAAPAPGRPPPPRAAPGASSRVGQLDARRTPPKSRVPLLRSQFAELVAGAQLLQRLRLYLTD